MLSHPLYRTYKAMVQDNNKPIGIPVVPVVQEMIEIPNR